MKINKTALRKRRLQLGITKSELGKACGVSAMVISRLEESGDATSLQVQTLVSILHNLSTNLVDISHHVTGEEIEPSTFDISELGQLLHDHGREIPKFQISACLGITLQEVETAIQELDSRLRQTGLCINSTSKGIRIVPSARSPRISQATEAARRTLDFEVLNHDDLSLLRRAMTTRLPSNAIKGQGAGSSSLRKLDKLDLIQVTNGVANLTDRAFTSLGYEQSEYA